MTKPVKLQFEDPKGSALFIKAEYYINQLHNLLGGGWQIVMQSCTDDKRRAVFVFTPCSASWISNDQETEIFVEWSIRAAGYPARKFVETDEGIVQQVIDVSVDAARSGFIPPPWQKN